MAIGVIIIAVAALDVISVRIIVTRYIKDSIIVGRMSGSNAFAISFNTVPIQKEVPLF